MEMSPSSPQHVVPPFSLSFITYLTMWDYVICLSSVFPTRVWSGGDCLLRHPWSEVKVLVAQFNSVQSLSRVWLFATPWTAAHQASLSITNTQSLLKLMSIESVMPSNHLTLCPLLLLPSVFPSIRVFSNESALGISWPRYWKKQIKTTMKYHLTLVRMAIIKNLQTINAGDGEVMEKREMN